MKKLLFLGILALSLFVSGCKKSSEANVSSAWVGVYVDPNSIADESMKSSLNSIIVTQIDASTLKIQIKALETSYIYNYTTLQSVAVNGETSATIDEIQGITEYTGRYHIQGKVTISNNHITLVATATNVSSPKEADVQNLYFSGDRKK